MKIKEFIEKINKHDGMQAKKSESLETMEEEAKDDAY